MFRILDVMLEKGSISCALGNSCKGPSVIFLHMCFSKTGLRKKAVIVIVGYVKEAVLQKKKKKTFLGVVGKVYIFYDFCIYHTCVCTHIQKKNFGIKNCIAQLSLSNLVIHQSQRGMSGKAYWHPRSRATIFLRSDKVRGL